MQTILVPQLAWHGPRPFKLTLPDKWEVEVCHMAGYNRPAMKTQAIAAAIAAPNGVPPLREMARGRKEVVIIVDDMSRVTQTYRILPPVLKELAQAGIRDSQIRIVMALGCHGAVGRVEFVKKLGKNAVSRFPVYNHNPFMNCSYVGTTSTFGTRVFLNDEVLQCDLKIAISSVVPHMFSGFGGGGKIILPGIASFETTLFNHKTHFHNAANQTDHPASGMGLYKNNPMHKDIEEAAEFAGLDFFVNALVNEWGETVSLHAGGFKPAYAAALEEAKEHYRTRPSTGNDIAIANTFAKANEGLIGLVAAIGSVSREGGDVVLLASTPDGQVIHYLLGPFGAQRGGPLWSPNKVPAHVNREIIFTEYPNLAGQGWFDESAKRTFIHKWSEVVEVLQQGHGAKARVALFPCAEIQYCSAT